MLKKFSKISKGQEGWLSRITRYITDSGKAMNMSIPVNALNKKIFETVTKGSLNAQAKTPGTIFMDLITGREPSFYSDNNINGSNEIDTYLYGKPYNTEFTGEEYLGPSYVNYIKKNYPDEDIKTYNTHFGDTLYIDESARPLVEEYIRTGKTASGNLGKFAEAPSYITTTEMGRPYDAGGMLMKFGTTSKGDTVAHMSDIYDFLPKDFNEKYGLQNFMLRAIIRTVNNLGTPFIVRLNNVPVRFKKIMPKYNTLLLQELGEFLSNWGDMFDLNIPNKLTDLLIDSIFRDAIREDGNLYGDDILKQLIKRGLILNIFE